MIYLKNMGLAHHPNKALLNTDMLSIDPNSVWLIKASHRKDQPSFRNVALLQFFL
jgi:hypothetical protein